MVGGIMLRVESISKNLGGNEVFNDLSLSVEAGQRLALVGPSGSGKTTVLKCIAGLIQIDLGKIVWRGKVFNDRKTFVSPWKRKVGMVFQDLALWPHLSVEQHLGSVFKWIKYKKERREQRLSYLLDLLEMDHFKLRYPHQLSGGQQQRLAIARLLAAEPEIALLDEAFNHLDAKLNEKIWSILIELQSNNDLTIIFTSHDNDTVDRFSTNLVNLTDTSRK